MANTIIKDANFIPPLLYNLNNLVPDSAYLYAGTGSTITASTIDTNIVFDSGQTVASKFTPSGAGFQYLGDSNQKFLVSISCFGGKIATNLILQLRLNKLTSPPLPNPVQVVASNFIDKTEGHLLYASEIIHLNHGDVVSCSAITSTGTCNIGTIGLIGGINSQSAYMILTEL